MSIMGRKVSIVFGNNAKPGRETHRHCNWLTLAPSRTDNTNILVNIDTTDLPVQLQIIDTKIIFLPYAYPVPFACLQSQSTYTTTSMKMHARTTLFIPFPDSSDVLFTRKKRQENGFTNAALCPNCKRWRHLF